MKICDDRHQVQEVASSWKRQYCYQGKWSHTIGGDTRVIYDKLAALSDTATAADVAEIIGNSSWAGPSDCHECGERVPRTVEIGQPADIESHTAQVCESCIRKALALFEQR